MRDSLQRVAQLLTKLLGVPSAQVNVISGDWQLTQADVNWDSLDIPRDDAFCSRTIELDSGEVLEVPDTRLDARFRANPLVTGPPHLRYYVGAPLRTPEGYAIGSLCLLGTCPRPPLTAEQRSVLSCFADLVMTELERHRAVRELREAFEQQHARDARLQALMRHTSDLVLIKDPGGRILDLNPAAEAVLGPRENVLGRPMPDCFGAALQDELRAADEAVMERGEHVHLEQPVLVQGRRRLYHFSSFALILADGARHGTVTVARDLTEREELERALREANVDLERRVQARTRALEDAVYRDSLTGLSNRRAFDLALDSALDRARRAAGAVHLLIFDLNELKAINDAHGHARGDDLLRAFASGLRRGFAQGSAFRFGGDEFAVLVEGEPSAPPLEQAAQVVQLTRDAGFPLASAAYGAACYPLDADAVSDLVRLADQRMLRNKTARRAEQHLRALPAVSPAPTPGVALQAIRATLNLLTLDGDLNETAWKGLLEAAVASVPGADAGSLALRDGEEFVYRAQVGFSDALLGMRRTVPEVQAWYGPGAWQEGRPRLISGTPALIEHSRAVASRPEQWELYERHGELRSLRASINVPVVLGGEVVAELNLDNLRHEAAFDAAALQLAGEFAAQAGALLAAARRRTSEAARRRELEVLARVTTTLRDVLTLEDVEAALCFEAASLLGTDEVVYLRHDPEEDTLQASMRGWPYDTHPWRFPRGQGVPWAALQGQRQLQEAADPHCSAMFNLTGARLLVTPLHTGGTPIGVLVAARPPGRTFTGLEAQLIHTVASCGITAVQRLWAERERTEREEELRLLAELARLAGLLEDPAEVARRCLGACRGFLQADCALYFHPQRQERVSDGNPPQALLDALPALNVEASRQAPAAPVSATAASPAGPTAPPALEDLGVRELVLTPVLERGRHVGFVALVWFRSLRSLPSAAGSLTARVAELIGRTLERDRHIQDLKSTHEGALRALGLSLELRDFETHGHTERVVTLSLSLGQHVALGGEDLEGLRQGAYLHDVGKLAVPDAVLLKPARLDPEEWRLAQSHAAVGADMIAGIPTIHPLAKRIVRHHHERWDGRGYPDGLAGAAIPLPVRIFSIIDVYDALTSERPYKRAWTHEEALAEIGAQAGAQFDPELVAAFLHLAEWRGLPGSEDPRDPPVRREAAGVRSPGPGGEIAERPG